MAYLAHPWPWVFQLPNFVLLYNTAVLRLVSGPRLDAISFGSKTQVKLPAFFVALGSIYDMKDKYENFLVLLNIDKELLLDIYWK